MLESLLMNLLKRDSSTGKYPVEYFKIVKNIFFTEHLRWLLLTNVYQILDYNKFRQIAFMFKNKILLIFYSQINNESK